MTLGTISKELLMEYRKWSRESDRLHGEMHLFLEQRAREVKAEFAEKYDDKEIEMRNKKNELWTAIEKELALSSEGAYSIDTDTGVITVQEETRHGMPKELVDLIQSVKERAAESLDGMPTEFAELLKRKPDGGGGVH